MYSFWYEDNRFDWVCDMITVDHHKLKSRDSRCDRSPEFSNSRENYKISLIEFSAKERRKLLNNIFSVFTTMIYGQIYVKVWSMR